MTEHLVNEEERVTSHNEECLKDSVVILKQHKDYVQLKVASPKLESLCSCVCGFCYSQRSHLILLFKQQKLKSGIVASV